MTFTALDSPLRTDERFRNRDNPLHHQPGQVSPLEGIGTLMVSQFRLDPLHLVYLGSLKRWLELTLVEAGAFHLSDEEV
ncbi:hypothetical protein FOCC_FOCC012842 [Frankliniella occidentalis]|nr:hypothetical protein FOCC_FOCC012842 [Frankliniella occidentalis]